MVLRSDRMVVGFTGYWHLLASLFALKINADSNSSLQKWAYDLRVPTTTLNCAIIVSHKPYLLVKWSYLLRVHLRVRFRLTTFSETVPSSLKERKKNKF